MIQLAENEWAFIPGPSEILDAPASSLDRHEIATYPPEAIAQAFLAYPGFSLMRDADPSGGNGGPGGSAAKASCSST